MSAFGWIVCAWPYLAAGIKRCHDRGKSGVWYLCWTTGCLGGWISAIYFQSWYAGFAGNLIALWTITEMGLLKGDPNTNRFGAPAREIGEESFRRRFGEQRPSALELTISVEHVRLYGGNSSYQLTITAVGISLQRTDFVLTERRVRFRAYNPRAYRA